MPPKRAAAKKASAALKTSASSSTAHPSASSPTVDDAASSSTTNAVAELSTDATDGFPFAYPPLNSADDASETDSGSDYGGRKKRKKGKKPKKNTRKRYVAPELPDLDYSPYGGSRDATPELGSTLFENQTPNISSNDASTTTLVNALPNQTAQFVLNIPEGVPGPITFNIDMASLLGINPFNGSLSNPNPTGLTVDNDTVKRANQLHRTTHPTARRSAPAITIGQPKRGVTLGAMIDATTGNTGGAAQRAIADVTVPPHLASNAKPTPTERYSLIKSKQALGQIANQNVQTKPPASFCDLPKEIRNRVYHMVLVAKNPVNFFFRENFANSGQFLATCKTVHKEGRVVLYGENVFHFEKTDDRRGKYWARDWEPVLWNDMRAFIQSIGPVNISLMRRLSFVFSDQNFPVRGGSPVDRRFVNEATLHHCLQMIGHHATNLEKVSMNFNGRRLVEKTDAIFLRALRTIKADEVLNTMHPVASIPSHINPKVLEDLISKMTKPVANQVHSEKVAKAYAVKMYCDYNYQSLFNTANRA